MPAACNDWHGVCRFHVGTHHHASTPDAGYTTAGVSLSPETSIYLAFWASPYAKVMAANFSQPASYDSLGDEPSDAPPMKWNDEKEIDLAEDIVYDADRRDDGAGCCGCGVL